MLPLDEREWTSLNHAYGNAADIPALLINVEKDPSPKDTAEEEPWFSLWSMLCHQGDVYSASFAAVPHLVRIAASATWPYAPNLLALPVSIELARIRRRDVVPTALDDSYSSALKQLPAVVCASSHFGWTHVFTQAATAALALNHGHATLAEAILMLGPSTVTRFLERDG